MKCNFVSPRHADSELTRIVHRQYLAYSHTDLNQAHICGLYECHGGSV
jgi:hypothetical protein